MKVFVHQAIQKVLSMKVRDVVFNVAEAISAVSEYLPKEPKTGVRRNPKRIIRR